MIVSHLSRRPFHGLTPPPAPGRRADERKAKLGTKTKASALIFRFSAEQTGTSSRAPRPWDRSRGDAAARYSLGARIPREPARKPARAGDSDTWGAAAADSDQPVLLARPNRTTAPCAAPTPPDRKAPDRTRISLVPHSPPRAATASPIKGLGPDQPALSSNSRKQLPARSSGFVLFHPLQGLLASRSGAWRRRVTWPGRERELCKGGHSERRSQGSTRGDHHPAAGKRLSSREIDRGIEDVHGPSCRAGEEGLARHRRAPRPPAKGRYVNLLAPSLSVVDRPASLVFWIVDRSTSIDP